MFHPLVLQAVQLLDRRVPSSGFTSGARLGVCGVADATHAHLGGKVGLLNGLAGVVCGQGKLCDIDDVCFNARAIVQFPGDKPSRVIRPILAVPKITWTNKLRLTSINLLLCEVQSLTSVNQQTE